MSFSIQTVNVRMYKPVVDQFRGWNGPLGRSIMRLARETRFRQRAMVGKRSGLLAQSITIGDRGHWVGGIQTTVGAGAGQRQSGHKGYAMANDQGARPHFIRPKRAGGVLVFYWAKVGRVVRLPSVFHPGNRPYHWAERGLRAAMAQWERGG